MSIAHRLVDPLTKENYDSWIQQAQAVLFKAELLEIGVVNIGVIDGVADAAFYNLFGYGGMQFVQLIDPPCSNVALLRNPNGRNLLPFFDPQKTTRELISLVSIYEQDGCKLQKSAVQEKINATAIFDSCHFWVVFESSKNAQMTYDQCYNDYLELKRHYEGDYRFAFIPTNTDNQECLVSVYGMNKQQPTQFNLFKNGMDAIYGVPSFLDEYRSRYRPCPSIPWKPVDLYDVMADCKFWIVVSVADESDWNCISEVEKFAVYSKDNFEFGYVKGPIFGVWLFLENKMTPVLAISDPVTCNVPAVFDIIKGQLDKVPPPPYQVCDNFANPSIYDVDAIAIVTRNKLMDSWDNWLVLQASPLSANYRNIYNEFKNLYNQLKGSFRFGFIPTAQFGLWMYGSNKHWPYVITSDTDDFLSQRYMPLLFNILNHRGAGLASGSPFSPYERLTQNYGGQLQPQIDLLLLEKNGINGQNLPSSALDVPEMRELPSNGGGGLAVLIQVPCSTSCSPEELRDLRCARSLSSSCLVDHEHRYQGSYYPSLGNWNAQNQPKIDPYGSRSIVTSYDGNVNHYPRNLMPADSAVTVSPVVIKNCCNSGGENTAFDGARGLDSVETSDEENEEFVLEPVLNVTAIPDEWKNGLNELFLNSKDFVVRVSFPYARERMESRSKDVVNPKLKAARALDNNSGHNQQLDGESALILDDEPDSNSTEPNVNIETDSSVKQGTEEVPAHPLSSLNLTPSSGARELSETAAETVTSSVGKETEISSTAATEASTSSMDTSSQSTSSATTVPTAERSADAAAVVLESSTTAETVTEATVPTETTGSAANESNTTTDAGTSPITVTEDVVTETPMISREPSTDNMTLETPETTTEAIIVEAESTVTTELAPTSIIVTEVPINETTTPKQRVIETTDVETVRKDCKFWVLISSSGAPDMEDKFQECYKTLTDVMKNYKNVYKFGAVETGQFFINLYLKNKYSPLLIASDYFCDEKQIRSALDAHRMETPGEFCMDPEDDPNSSTTSTTESTTTWTRATSTVAPGCALQLVVRYPKKEAKKYQSCLGELNKVINSKEPKWMLKQEDQPAFNTLLWTTAGLRPLINLKLANCRADSIQQAVNEAVTITAPSCAYVRG